MLNLEKSRCCMLLSNQNPHIWYPLPSPHPPSLSFLFFSSHPPSLSFLFFASDPPSLSFRFFSSHPPSLSFVFFSSHPPSKVRTYAHYPNMPNFETESVRISPGVIRRKEGWCSFGNIVFESHFPFLLCSSSLTIFPFLLCSSSFHLSFSSPLILPNYFFFHHRSFFLPHFYHLLLTFDFIIFFF